jgi:hypothetical protein
VVLRRPSVGGRAREPLEVTRRTNEELGPNRLIRSVDLYL